MIIFLVVVALLTLSVFAFMRLPRFGRLPAGSIRERMLHSPDFKDGEFRNREFTPQFTGGASMGKVTREFFFGKKSPLRTPPQALPSVKTDLHKIDRSQNIIIWFGHSSYYMQVDGIRLLVDPVFSGSASPIPVTTKAFKGSDIYGVNDIPDLDYLVLTHDHWDHLDYRTMLAIKGKVKQVVTSLGVGAHLQRWGFDPSKITELSWDERKSFDDGCTFTSVTARHFSGRTFKRGQSIWGSFAWKTKQHNIFIGGDSGYGKHFKEAGEKLGPFDLAILECGQYNEYWANIHMMPEETVQAAIDLKAKQLLPVHWGKFALSLHEWDEPIKRATAEAQKLSVPVLTPMIGAVSNIDEVKKYEAWWTDLS